MKILEERNYYRPFQYPWAYEYFLEQTHKMHWDPDKISFATDIKQFATLEEPEKRFIKKIFTFFVQSDNNIGEMYVKAYLPRFQQPELRMMLLSFANMESIHAQSYAKLMEALGFEDYQNFLTYPEMKEKHEYFKVDPNEKEDIPSLLRDIAMTSAFGEGLQLFGSFTMLLSFVERGLFPGMGDVVSFSLRDESVHVRGLIEIFHAVKQDYIEYWVDETKRKIYSATRDMVELEDRFISLVYEDDLHLSNLPKADLHKYIRYLADHRLGQLGLKPEYYVKENPIKWLHLFTNDVQEDLFNNTGTSYVKSSRDWDDLF